LTGERQFDAPKLLVEWSSPWQEFRTAIRPALARSGKPLAGEAQSGLFPHRKMLMTWGVEIVLILAFIMLPGKLARMLPYRPPTPPKYDVIYYSADELPRTEDNGGSSAGHSGRGGGQHGFHRTQAIRVAREEIPRERVVDAPKLNLPHSDSAVANLLAFKSIPGPVPAEGLKSQRQAPTLPLTAIAPAPTLSGDPHNVARDVMRTAPTLSAKVVPPAPSPSQRDLAAMRLPGSQPVQVIPPPVSAPETASNLHPKLTLPAPAVIAPPPSQITRDLAKTGPGYGPGELQKQVVPPPAQMTGPSTERRALAGLGSSAVVPPPVEANGQVTSARKLGDLGGTAPIAPPVQVSGGATSMRRAGTGNLDNGTVVVPPPPSVANGAALGSGRGNRGTGMGGLNEIGSVSAPAASGGSGNSTGVVVSREPGQKPGVPTNSSGSLALSPTGGPKPGLGGSGGGTGNDFGPGAGSGATGSGPGAAKSGTGKGAELAAKGGTSPYPGTGGAGSGTVGPPPLPGVSVHGGSSNIITLPSFGTNSSAPTVPGHTSSKDQKGGGITVVATSRSGGAFNFYGALKGDKVYTIYIPTSLGTAVMQFADPASAEHPYTETLASPQPLRTDLPNDLRPSRLILSCILDKFGEIKNLRVLEPGDQALTARILAALPNWKFSPALHGNQPVEVNAILGFDIDTR